MSNQSRRTALKAIGSAALLPFSMPLWAQGRPRPDLRIAMQDLRVELDPLHPRSTALVSFRVLESVYDKLFAIDYGRNAALRPMLAESIDTTDDVNFRVRLRKGVKFHNGEEMTAEDVAFTFGPERMLAKSAPGYGVGQISFPTLASVNAVDRYTVHFTTHAPDPVFSKRLTSYGGGIVCKAAYLKAGSFDKWARSPVTAGPYKVVEVAEGSHVRLEAHDAYWGGMPPLKSIEFRLIREPAARVAGLRAGDFDIVTTLTPDQFDTITSDPRLDVVGGDTLSFRTLTYDTLTNPVLKDARIRRAMNLAIDRQGIVKSIWRGRITVPHSHQNPSYGALYDASRPIPRYDPASAKKLLDLAGYKGETIVFKTVGNYYPNELAETQAIAAMWSAAGLHVDIQTKENWSQVEDQTPRWVNNSSDGEYYPDPAASFLTRWGAASQFQTAGRWKNDRFNQLETVVLTERNPDKRRAAFQEMLVIFDETDPPGTVLHSLGEFFGKRASIKWTSTRTGLMDFRPGSISV